MKTFNELIKSSKIQEDANKSLFSDICPTGYSKRAELINHLETLSLDDKKRWQLSHLDAMFKFMKANGTLSREPQHATEDGEDFTWLNLTMGKVKRTIRILHFAGIKNLIDDYANGSVKINQTLEELYNEALS